MTIFNFEMLNVPFANGAISTEIAPFPDWNRGLGIAFEQTEGKPEMKGLNGLFQVLTTSMLYLKQRGIAEWDSALEYPANAFVAEGAKLYKSKRTNTNKQPSLSQLDWDVWASISDISVSTNGNLKKTVAADGSVTLEVPTATDTQRGAVRQATSTEVANRSNVNAYVTPKNVQDMFVGTFSASGSLMLPSGHIMKWGKTSNIDVSTSGTLVNVVFPSAFPNACLNLQLTADATGGTNPNAFASVLTKNSSGFSAYLFEYLNTTQNVGISWFAIGY